MSTMICLLVRMIDDGKDTETLEIEVVLADFSFRQISQIIGQIVHDRFTLSLERDFGYVCLHWYLFLLSEFINASFGFAPAWGELIKT